MHQFKLLKSVPPKTKRNEAPKQYIMMISEQKVLDVELA